MGTTPVFAELRSPARETSGPADVLRAAPAPLAPETRAAFVFGAAATHDDTAADDVDLFGERLTYAEFRDAPQAVEPRVGRAVSPTVFAPAEPARRGR